MDIRAKMVSAEARGVGYSAFSYEVLSYAGAAKAFDAPDAPSRLVVPSAEDSPSADGAHCTSIISQ